MTKPPYLLVSDLHCHAWSAFAKTGPDGLNSRLKIILDELERAAEVLRKAGGNLIVIAGDIFHERGKLAPSVFNPTHATFKKLLRDFRIIAIPGNHDLEGKDTTELGNAIQSLGALNDFAVITHPELVAPNLAMIPWCSSYDALRQAAMELFDGCAHMQHADLIIHAGINGVIAGLPDHGLDAIEVAGWGFKRVLGGHYHNHRVLEGGKVVSIGATTHQQWGDIGTKAGFLLVYDDRIEHHASHAPAFIEITGDTDPEEIPLLVDGNYVRIRGMKLTDAEIGKFRAELEEMGAKGVMFQVARETVSARSGKTAKGLTLEESVAKHIDGLKLPNAAAVKSICEDILTSVRSVSA